MDVALLARLQFAVTAAYHYCFVPVNVGLGLIVALMYTRYYKTRSAEDAAVAKWWTKFFAVAFAMGIATGITMEFSFGTNWANYSRFVGDIFGAPLAAEALLAFFMESTFLGVLLLGWGKVSEKFHMISSWLVFAGSTLSCLWILIANSWMQTPAGYHVEGGKAVLDDFFAAAFNPSTGARFFHTVDALIIMGALIAIAVGAYHLRNKKTVHSEYFGKRQIMVGSIVVLIACILMLPASHQQAVVVAEHQPEKLAAMEGQYEDGPADMYLFGFVDEANEQVVGLTVPIPGMTSFLASNDFTTVYPGLHTATNEFERRIAEIQANPEYTQFIQQVGTDQLIEPDATAPVQITFQSYHLMVALYGFIVIWVILALVARVKLSKGGQVPGGLLKALYFGPIFPFLAIEAGWFVAEFGRQPWIVWEELLMVDAISPSVDPIQLLITMVLFLVVYVLLMVLFLKNAFRIIKEGPEPVKAVEGQVM